MKTLKFYFTLTLVFAFAAAVALTAQPNRSKIVKSFTTAPGSLLDVNINPGNVNIKSWDKNEVLVKVADVEENDSEGIEIKQRGNAVFVRFNAGWGWADDIRVDVTVPVNFDLDISTSGGDIKLLSEVNGKILLSTSGGNIKIRNASGNLKAQTSGGDVTAGDVNGPVRLSTSGGDITIGSVKGGEVELNTMGGDIKTGNIEKNISAKTYGGVIEIGEVSGEVDATTFGGDIKLKSGMTSVELSTYGGDIELRHAEGKVTAETKGGEVILRGIKGSVEASSAAGDIYVELDPSTSGKSIIKTSNGDVELALSSSAKADIDAVIKTYRSRDDYNEIRSSFEGKVERSKKEVRGKFKVNGGGHKIYLKTVNSDIKISKK